MKSLEQESRKNKILLLNILWVMFAFIGMKIIQTDFIQSEVGHVYETFFMFKDFIGFIIILIGGYFASEMGVLLYLYRKEKE